MFKNFWITILFTFLISSIVTYAQTNNERTGKIIGRVVNQSTQNPIPGVTVIVLETKLGAISDSQGRFEINNVPIGMVAVQFSSVGYEKFVQSDVNVNTARANQLNIQLVEKIIELEGAEVRSSYFVKRLESATSTQTFSAEDIRRAPGVQEDVVRATALLPGVAVTSAGRNDLIVRGGAPFENLFLIDNIEVPNINHFGTQGSTGGPLSIINIDFVKNVTFSAGAYGAKYGDKTSSRTEITIRNGNEDKFGGKLNLSATGFGAYLEGPISDKGSYIVSARRSYLDFIFSAAGFSFIPQYWDFQTKVNYRLDNNNRLTFLGIGALGNVKLNNDDSENRYDNSRITVPNQDQYFSGLTWQHLFGTGFMNLTLGRTYTRFSTYQNDSLGNKVFNNESKEGETSLKADFEFRLSDKFDLQFGNQTKYGSLLEYDIDIPGNLRTDQFGNPQPLSLDTNFQTIRNFTYVSMTMGIGRHKVTAGGRMNYYDYLSNKLFFSPRLSVVYQINDVSAINLGLGRYYQSPSFIWLLGDPDQDLTPIRADQIVLGYDHSPLEDVKVQVELYYKWYSNYPARVFRPQAVLSPSGFDDITSDIPYGLEPLQSSGTGYSRGIEFFIQKRLSDIPLYGLFSLTLSESRFKSLDGEERYGAYDSRVIMNLSAGYRLSKDWELSGKFRIATGMPTTPFNPDGTRNWELYNEGDRYSLFHALDIRVDKRWDFDNFYLVTYLDIQNIYGRKNESNYKWNYRTMQAEYSSSIGVLPSIGVSFEF